MVANIHRHDVALPANRFAARLRLVGAVSFALWVGSAIAAPKTDVVVLANGDRITGEIKSLERGLLTLKTDALDTVQIQWLHVAGIETRQLLEVRSADDRRYVGHVDGSADAAETLQLRGTDRETPTRLPLSSVVELTPLSEGALRNRLDGHLSLGFSAASANHDRQATLSADLSYRDERNSFQASYDGARTKSANNPALQRQNAEALYRWFPSERRFWAATASMTRNDELGLDLRSLVGVGVGSYWMRSPERELWWLAGVATTRERYSHGESRQNAEGVLQAHFDLFRFDHPKVDVAAELALYPSLSIGGRVRSEFSLQTRIELIKDLYYELSYQRSADNKPPEGGRKEVDWSLVSSVGYKF